MSESCAKVFLDYDQAALDRAYDQRAWAPNAEQVITRYAAASAAIRARRTHRANLSYGPTADEVIDFFPSGRSGAPIQIFIHGGAWKALSKEESAFAAETFIGVGAHFVALNFANLPKVRLPEMVAQIRRAIAWIHRHAAALGGDPDRLYVSGHSSGAHLAAMALITDWPRSHGLPAHAIKAGLLASGIYDLAPVRLSARGRYLTIDDGEEAAFSPLRHLDRLRSPVVIAYGERESPEFIRQAKEFATALDRAQWLAELVVCPGLNHFELIETLADPAHPLARAALKQMGLVSGRQTTVSS